MKILKGRVIDTPSLLMQIITTTLMWYTFGWIVGVSIGLLWMVINHWRFSQSG